MSDETDRQQYETSKQHLKVEQDGLRVSKIIGYVISAILSLGVAVLIWMAKNVSQLNARVGTVIEAQSWIKQALDENKIDIKKNTKSIRSLERELINREE